MIEAHDQNVGLAKTCGGGSPENATNRGGISYPAFLARSDLPGSCDLEHRGGIWSGSFGRYVPLHSHVVLPYRASKHVCAGCALKARCCPKDLIRKVPRSIHEGARDMARQIARSWEGRVSRRLRKKVEMLFAHLKRILKLDRLRLRGPNGARDEFLLAATAQNLQEAIEADIGAELPASLKTASLSKPPRCQISPSIDFDLLPEFFNRIGHKTTWPSGDCTNINRV